ncbi:hypothetical protein GLX27_001171 [Malassezia furfur]|uniref:Cytochrome c oxidase subunit 8, mitochondrial n=1 Tax=Malassezia furfur TaxID=55194 RepID=A0ABY8ENG3_MALFU|nr:hypothetical protein CBS14141_001166 [Malassezia furfur]WFD46534.1 hypothetical protein GLX27_001171 [Malassezia furfur]
MSVFLTASRASLRATRAPAMQLARRNAHFENTAETSLPFPQGRKHSKGLALGVFGFFATGLSVPFLITYYQLHKP